MQEDLSQHLIFDKNHLQICLVSLNEILRKLDILSQDH